MLGISELTGAYEHPSVPRQVGDSSLPQGEAVIDLDRGVDA